MVKKIARKKNIIISFVLLIALAVLSLRVNEISAQSPSPQATATPSPTASPTPTAQTTDELPSPYESVISMTERTLSTVKWGMSIALTVVTLIVGIAAGITVYQGVEARKAAEVAHAKALAAQEGITDTANRIESALEAASTAERSASKAGTQFETIAEELDEVSERLKDLDQQASSIRKSLGVFGENDLRFLATLRLIDQRRSHLFSPSDPEKKQKAEWALLEKSATVSPLIRREAVIALAGLEEPSEGVVERFKEVVAEEDDPEIRKLAQQALKAWGLDD